MTPPGNPPTDRGADRQGRRLMRPAPPFLLLASCLAVVGIVLLIFTSGWAWALGIVLIALAGPPAAIGIALATAGAITRWAAHSKPFA
jgi:MFS family permease